MTKCITFTEMLIIDVYLTEITHKYALRTFFFFLTCNFEVFKNILKFSDRPFGIFIFYDVDILSATKRHSLISLLTKCFVDRSSCILQWGTVSAFYCLPLQQQQRLLHTILIHPNLARLIELGGAKYK